MRKSLRGRQIRGEKKMRWGQGEGEDRNKKRKTRCKDQQK